MKIRTMMILLSALLVVSAQAFGQAVVLDSVGSGSLRLPDSIMTGDTVKFYIRFNNNTAQNIVAFSNGFRIYSTDGAQWTQSSIDTLSNASARGWGKIQMDGGIFFNFISADGQLGDTVGLGGYAVGAGVPAGTNNLAAVIKIGPIPTGSAYHQKHICIDTAYYPPGGEWLWSDPIGNSLIATWPGPYCYTVWDQSTGVGDGPLNPYTFSLAQNYPNPFNPTTNISFSLAEKSHVELSVYNVLGQKIRTLVSGEKAPGIYTEEWDGSSVASGVYFYRLETEKFTSTKKMMLVK